MMCVNELKVEEYILGYLNKLNFTDNEAESFKKALKASRQMAWEYTEKYNEGSKLKLTEAKNRKGKILDLFLDGKITEEERDQENEKIILYIRSLEEKISQHDKTNDKSYQKIEQLGKLLKSPYLSYKTALPDKKRRLVKSLVENFSLTPDKLDITWKSPFDIVANRGNRPQGGDGRIRTSGPV